MPYPNVVQDSDGSGANKVKIQGKDVLRKGDKCRMSSGDEGGTAGGGVVSNKIKGEAEILQGCSTVKAQGKDVAYVLVTVGQNASGGKNAPSGKAVAPGQTQVVLRSVRGKQTSVREKVSTYKPGETNVPPDQATQNAAGNAATAQGTQAARQASEQVGDAGARNAMSSAAQQHGGLVEGPISFSGPGTVDVVGLCKNGVILVFEAKGGASPLGTAMAGAERVRQGTTQYLSRIADRMSQSTNSLKAAWGDRIKAALNRGKVKYCEARTELDQGPPPKATDTKVREFDP